MTITVNIKCSNGTSFSVETEETETILEFKKKLEIKSNIPAGQQRLIYSGHVLKDVQTISSYSIKDGHAVHLVRGASNNTSQQATTGQPQSQPTTTPQQPAPSPFGGMGGMPFANPLGGGMNFQQMQQQLMQNPNLMRELMNNPMVQSIMSNPEMLRTMLMSNPQMRELIERNPEIGHILNDPQILRQTLEMARNPELMREMMRNTDRAMSNIESMPEGFNLLRRMYSQVQEPMMDATQQTMQQNNPFASLFGNQPQQQQQQQTNQPTSNTPSNAPLPNPWGGGSGTTNQPQAQPSTPVTGQQPTSSMPFNPFGAMNDQAMMQMLSNPGVQQLMQQMFSNPEIMQQALSSNPYLSSMVQANPAMMQMLQNPDFMRQMTNPSTIQALMQLQNAVQTLQNTGLMNMMNPFGFPQPQQPSQPTTEQGAQPSSQPTTGQQTQNPQPSQPTTQPNPFDFAQMLFGMPSAFGVPQPQQPQQPAQPPEVRFQVQLQQLNDMGFLDQQANIRALEATAGNVQLAIERLLSGL